MRMYKLYWTACLIVLHTHTSGGLQYVSRTDSVTYSEANSICSSFGESWGLPSDITSEDHKRLASEMMRRGWKTMWLSHVKQELEHWMWLDGKKYTGHALNGGKCGFYNRHRAHKYGSTACMGESRRGYICKLAGRECSTDLLASLGECVHHHGGVYLLGCAAPDWYSARSLCRHVKGNLASEPIDATPTYGYEETCKSGNPWIGLHKEDWAYITPQNQSAECVNTSFWQVFADSPVYYNANTSVMRVSQGSYVWMAEESTERHHVLCQNYKSEVSSTAESSTTSEKGGKARSTAQTVKSGPTDPREEVPRSTTASCQSASIVIVFVALIILGVVLDQRFRCLKKLAAVCRKKSQADRMKSPEDAQDSHQNRGRCRRVSEIAHLLCNAKRRGSCEEEQRNNTLPEQRAGNQRRDSGANAADVHQNQEGGHPNCSCSEAPQEKDEEDPEAINITSDEDSRSATSDQSARSVIHLHHHKCD